MVIGPLATAKPLNVPPMKMLETLFAAVTLARAPAVPSSSFLVPNWVLFAMRSMVSGEAKRTPAHRRSRSDVPESWA